MSRFFRRGKTRMFWCSTIVDPTAPTATEVSNGVEISGDVSEISGFTYKTDRIKVPDLSSPFTSSIGGEQVADDSSAKIYLDSVSNPLRTTLDQDAQGFIVFCDYKPDGDPIAAADIVDVYPAQVIGRPKERSVGNDAAMWEAQFGLTDIPAEDVEVV